MIRFPGAKNSMSQPPATTPTGSWKATAGAGSTVRQDRRHAVVWNDHGRWTVHYALDDQSPTFEGRSRPDSSEGKHSTALSLSSQMLISRWIRLYEDMQTRWSTSPTRSKTGSPQEREAIDRMHRLPRTDPRPVARRSRDRSARWARKAPIASRDGSHADPAS